MRRRLQKISLIVGVLNWTFEHKPWWKRGSRRKETTQHWLCLCSLAAEKKTRPPRSDWLESEWPPTSLIFPPVSKLRKHPDILLHVKSRHQTSVVASNFGWSSTHSVSEVCRQFLDLLELFDLLWVYVLLQLPRRLLVRQTAPLNEVMGHLLQQHTQKHAVRDWERATAPR